MSASHGLSNQTKNNWRINAVVLISAVLASLSGVYFLFLPMGGYQGGRNPYYGITILFNRSTWDLIHTWTGVVMIAAIAIHFSIHWKWVVSITRRVYKELTGQCCTPLNRHARFNIFIDALVALGFLLTAVSGVYFLFFPSGAHGVPDPMLLFNRTTWDLVHTWAAVVMIVAAIIHFAIHWQWVVKVTRRYFQPSPRRSPAAASVQAR